MTPEVQRPTLSLVHAQPMPLRHGETPRDCSRAERVRQLWPDAVDLAKQPGLLYRLHAILTN